MTSTQPSWRPTACTPSPPRANCRPRLPSGGLSRSHSPACGLLPGRASKRGYQPSLGLFSPDGEARLSSQDPVSSLHRDGPGDCTVSRHFAVPAGLPGDGVVWVAGEPGAVKPIRRFLRDEVRLDPLALP